MREVSEISQGRIFGYARVSSTEQNLDRQLAELAKYQDGRHLK
ncbi:MAG: recombinase family protein [Butyribacter sp.]